MNNILITGAGGSVYSAIIPQLLESKIFNNYYFIDIDDNCAMKFICEKEYFSNMYFIKCPSGDSLEYKLFIKHLIIDKKINFCLPLVDEELLSFLELYNYESINFKLCLPKNKDFVQRCLNKKETIKMLQAINIETPYLIEKSDLTNYYDSNLKIIVKPLSGHGSNGIYKFTADKVMGLIFSDIINVDNYCFQEYIEGDEYTVSVIDNIVVPKKIIKKKGITISAVTEYNSIIEKTCLEIVDKLKPDGPFNVQGKLYLNKFKVFEINPRLSTTTILTHKAGLNEVIYGFGLDNRQINIKWGIEMHRFYYQLFNDRCKK